MIFLTETFFLQVPNTNYANLSHVKTRALKKKKIKITIVERGWVYKPKHINHFLLIWHTKIQIDKIFTIKKKKHVKNHTIMHAGHIGI